MRLRSLEKILHKINQLSDTMAEKTDAELQKQTVVFKAALKNGKSLDDILPQAYAHKLAVKYHLKTFHSLMLL